MRMPRFSGPAFPSQGLLETSSLGRRSLRRRRDSNPRRLRATVFKTVAFDHSATPPRKGPFYTICDRNAGATGVGTLEGQPFQGEGGDLDPRLCPSGEAADVCVGG